MTAGVCESCGRQEGNLTAVHRVYVTPEAWDQPERVDVVDAVERWCFACLTHYPHQAVADG